MTQNVKGQPQEFCVNKQLMERTEVLQTVLYVLGALAIGGGGVAGWKLLHQPWQFLSLPLIGVVAGIPWLSTIFIREDQVEQMGVSAFRHQLSRRFMWGAVGGALAAALSVAILLYMLWQPGQWPSSAM